MCDGSRIVGEPESAYGRSAGQRSRLAEEHVSPLTRLRPIGLLSVVCFADHQIDISSKVHDRIDRVRISDECEAQTTTVGAQHVIWRNGPIADANAATLL